MGGKLVLVQRKSDGCIRKAKIGTWFLHNLNTVDALNETYFDKIADKNQLFSTDAHDISNYDSYESNAALFAPYHYGIVVYDFKDKKVFSCNNFDGFLLFGENNIRSDYESIGPRHQTKIPVLKAGNYNEVDEYLSVYTPGPHCLKTPPIIESMLRHGARLYKNDKPFILRPEDDFFTIGARIYGKDLKGVSKKDIYESYANTEELICNMSFWQNMRVEVPGWEILNGDASIEYIQSAYSYYLYTGCLTDEEQNIWQDFITSLKR